VNEQPSVHTIEVLFRLAAGQTTRDILSATPHITQVDIETAALEALALLAFPDVRGTAALQLRQPGASRDRVRSGGAKPRPAGRAPLADELNESVTAVVSVLDDEALVASIKAAEQVDGSPILARLRRERARRLGQTADTAFDDHRRNASQVQPWLTDRGANFPWAPYQREVRKKSPRAWEPWSQEEDDALETMVNDDMTITEIAGLLGRQYGAIQSRIKHVFPGREPFGAERS
jgi:hypothetical protein